MIPHKALSVFLLAAVTLAAAEDLPRPAPALEAKTIDGRSISLSELKGKVVGVLFFLTDCPHCQQTTQSVLAPAYARMKSRGLEIIGMAINHPQWRPISSLSPSSLASPSVGALEHKRNAHLRWKISPAALGWCLTCCS